MTQKSETRQQVLQGSTLGVGVLLFLALFAMVNYLALRHYQRFDWTSSKLYSLTEKSLSVARAIDQEIDMVIFLNPDSELYGAADELLSRYAAANPQQIKKREVDPAKNLLQAQRLVEKYSIERDNVLVIASADDRRVIDEFELAEYDYSGAQFGQAPKLTEFKGEQLITSALLALVEAKKPRVLFTTGHGEAQLERGGQRSFSRARDLLGKDNFDTEEWSSLGKSEVPADTDLIVIAGPTTNFLPPELDLFSSYLDSGGRLLMMIDPVFAEGTGAIADLGLRDWLLGYGIEIRDDIVVDPSSELPFFGAETIFTDSYGSHPIVEALEQTRTRVLLPLARSISKSADAPAGFQVTELVRTSDAGWGETDLEALDKVEEGEEDLPGPVTLGIAVSFEVSSELSNDGDPSGVEPGGPTDDSDELPAGESVADSPAEPDAFEAFAGDSEGFDDDGEEDAEEDGEEDVEEDGDEARLVVFGDFDFASDSQIGNGANALLLLNTLNWLVKREHLIDIEARRPEQTSLNLSRAELSQVYLLVLLILPGLSVAFGIWVYMRRRR